jgi:hypothetical protein
MTKRRFLIELGALILIGAAAFVFGWYVPEMVGNFSAPKVAYAQAIGWPVPPYQPANVSFTGTSNATLVSAPTAGGVCVYGLLLINAGASADTISIYLDGGTTAVATVYLAASGGSANFQLGQAPKSPYFLTNNATAFVVKSSANVQIDGSVYAATCP